MFSYQSLMPAGAGTPRCEKRELWLGTANRHGGVCHPHPDPSGGQAPALHFPVPSGVRRIDMKLPARLPTSYFLPMTTWVSESSFPRQAIGSTEGFGE